MRAPHVTFDLETLGVGNNAPIIQLAAVAFRGYEIIDEFDAKIEINTLSADKFVPDIETVNWWMKQDKVVIDSVFFGQPRVHIQKALMDFSNWIKANNYLDYWCHSTFDYGILKAAYEKSYLAFPIKHRYIRDIRTLESVTDNGLKRNQLKQKYHNVHNALVDCKIQAEYIAHSLSLINQ
jgi:DNA polymerase III alpha subunit (gram-positive type)